MDFIYFRYVPGFYHRFYCKSGKLSLSNKYEYNIYKKLLLRTIIIIIINNKSWKDNLNVLALLFYRL